MISFINMLSLLVLLLRVGAGIGDPLPPVYMFTATPESDPELHVPSDRPIVCNNRTEFECICVLPSDSTHTAPTLVDIPPCSKFIKTNDLPVVDMRMRHVNTEELLYTGMSYEEYFKKRIASIVSHYCQHNANECPGTTMRMSQVSQRNVVLLRMEKLRGNFTRMLFVVTKHDRTGGRVDEDNIVDPTKIKYILGSLASPLSRALGGIRIESVREARLRRNAAAYYTDEQRRDNARDNSRLIIALLFVLGFLGITYLIALVRCLFWCKAKREKRRQDAKVDGGLAATTDGRNYGTCENKRRPSRNGNTVNHIEERIPLTQTTYQQIDENANEEPREGGGGRRISERQARNWFMCDASQLPRELTIDDSLVNEDLSTAAPAGTPQPTIERVEVNRVRQATPPSPQKAVPTWKAEEYFPPSDAFTEYVDQQYNKNRETSPDQARSSTSPSTVKPAAPPPVVILQSSFREDTPDIPIVSEQPRMEKSDTDRSDNKLRSESPPVDRPRSRRGSRVDEPEGLLDLRELRPLHSEDPLAEPLEVPIPPEQINDDIERWSSSEEGEVDVYYKMSDEEDVTKEEEEWKKAIVKAGKHAEKQKQESIQSGSTDIPVVSELISTRTPPTSPLQSHEKEDSDSEVEDEEGVVEKAAEDAEGFVYERLREELSPQPPIVVDVDTTDLDLEPIKQLPPPPPGIYPDSPPESGNSNIAQSYEITSNSSQEEEDDLR